MIRAAFCRMRRSLLLCFLLVSAGATAAVAAQSPWVATDNYGYQGHNQDSFLWYNITGSGQRIPMQDDSVTTIPIPFPFTFYGVQYNNVAVNSNGLLCFTTSSSDLANTYIPSAVPPNAFLAPFWDDLDPSQTAGQFGVFWGTLDLSTVPLQRAFVVTWYQVPFYSDANEKVSFQVVLLENTNEIKFVYLNMPASARGTGGGATIGIESGYLGGQYGIQYGFDTPGVVEGIYSLTFCPPPGCTIPNTPTPTPTGIDTPSPTPTVNLPPSYTVSITNLDTQGFPLNTVRVKVADTNGDPVRGLTHADFNLSEDGVDQYVLQPVTNVGNQGIGISVALGVDVSGSMSDQDVKDAGDSVINFVNNMTCTDRVALFSFEDDVVLEVPFTQDRGVIETAAKALGPLGATAMFDCMWDAITLTIPQPGAKAVIVFTDGGDNSSTHTQQQVINLAVNNQIPVYTIGLGAAISSAPLIAVANATGGKYYAAPTAPQIAAIYDEIAQSIRDQYLLQYETTNNNPNGTQRTVEVCVGTVCGSRSYRAFDPCILDHNEKDAAPGSQLSDATHIVAQKFTSPKFVFLESLHVYFEYGGSSVVEVGVFTTNPAGDAPSNPIAFSIEGPRLISCPGWQTFDFSNNVPQVTLVQGGEYWLVVRYISGAPARIRFSAPGSSLGGVAIGDRTGAIYNWLDYNPDLDLYFRALSCTLAPPVNTPTPTPSATSTVVTSTPTPTLSPTPSPTNTPSTTPTSTPTFTPSPTMTPSNTPTKTPSSTPTSSPTLTPSNTPTHTPTPDLTPPVILMAGYGNTNISTDNGGTLYMYAWVDTGGLHDTDTVEIYSGNTPLGVFLHDDGISGCDDFPDDEIFTFCTPVGPGVPPGCYLLELTARDSAGNKSDLWPYLHLKAGASSAPGAPDVQMRLDASLSHPMLSAQVAQRRIGGPNDPIVFVGGYMQTNVTVDQGGTVNLATVVIDPNNDVNPAGGVQLMYQLIPVDTLCDTGTCGDFGANDQVFGWQLGLGPIAIPPTRLQLEVQAQDMAGHTSSPWPYFCVPSPTPTTTPTATPTPRPEGCFEFLSPQGDPPRQKAGEWVVVDASCSTDTCGLGLQYRWDWGDGSGTSFDPSPRAQHIYSSRGRYSLCLTIRDGCGFTAPAECRQIEIY